MPVVWPFLRRPTLKFVMSRRLRCLSQPRLTQIFHTVFVPQISKSAACLPLCLRATHRQALSSAQAVSRPALRLRRETCPTTLRDVRTIVAPAFSRVKSCHDAPIRNPSRFRPERHRPGSRARFQPATGEHQLTHEQAGAIV